jgi:group I intron endonuclease
MNKVSGIYQIQSIARPDRYYIGSAVNIQKRWNRHKSDLKYNKHENKKLQRHCNIYGIEDLVFTVLKVCNVNEILFREQFRMDILNPYFNICKTAGSRLGIKHSEESKLLMSKKMTGNKNRLGVKCSEATKQKMSIAKKGNKYTLGKKASEETKLKMRGNKNHLGFRKYLTT